MFEERKRVLDRHVEDLGDVLPPVGDLERLAVVAPPSANLTGNVHVGKEVHLDFDLAVALAGLAAAAAHIEAEATRGISARLRLLRRGEQGANVVPQPDVGGRVAARRSTDGALVDVDDLVNRLKPGDLTVRARAPVRVVHAVGQGRRERVGDKRAFTRAGYAGDHGERADGHLKRDVFQVVLRGTRHLEGPPLGMATSLRHLDLATARQIVRRKGALRLHDLGRSSRRDHFPAALARARPHVDHEVGAADGILVVLDHDDGVAEVAQMLQRGDKPLVVALMQADRRFVQDIKHAHEPRADLRGKADALGLAARQRGGGALERQVVESHVHEEFQSRLDFLHDGPRDALGLARERKAVEERIGIGGRHLRHIVDGFAAHGDGEDFGLQALTVAGLTGHRREILLESLALRVGLRLLVAAHNRSEHAFPLDVPVRLAAVDRDVVDAHLLLAEARHDGLLRAARHVLPWSG